MNEQYSRRECGEIAGIPNSVKDSELEEKVCGILNEINAPISPNDIEACPRLRNRKVILKFSRRKKCAMVLKNRSQLKKIDGCKFGLTKQTKIYINESLCGYNKGLWNMCRKLKGEDFIY